MLVLLRDLLMSLDRCSFILLIISIRSGFSADETNELAKVCRPVALRLNVIFLLDGSGSVSGNTFDMQMKMLNNVVNMMDIGKNDSQIAVLQYAGYTKLETDFNESQDPDKLLDSLRKIRYMSGTTKTGKAMFKALELFEKAKQNKEQDALQVAVIVTDGHSSDNPMPAAKALRDAGVTILTLGIGEHVNRNEIVNISGKDELAFQELHKEVSLRNFISGFKNLSQGQHCEYARGSNGVQITCGHDFIQAEVSTTKKLEGRFYFEGFHADPGCFAADDSVQLDSQKAYYNAKIRSAFGKCGLEKSYQSSNGFVISGRVILQFDRHFASARDPSFEIRCLYNGSAAASNGIAEAESELQDQSREKVAADSTKRTKCRYEVKPQKQTCSTSGINIGAQLLHRWTCNNAHKRFFVHSCVVMDPTTQRSRPILDSQGCSLDKSVISDISYLNDGTATSVGNAIRFADSPTIRYSCHLRLFEGQDSDSFKNRCRRKRQVTFEQNSPGFVEPIEQFPAYDDVEKLLPDLDEVIRDLVKEKMSALTTTTQQPKVFPFRSSASFFPYGGIDVPLTSKRVAIVKTEQARDRYKQDLQLRTKATGSNPAQTGRSSLRELIVLGDEARHYRSSLDLHPMHEVASTAELTNKKEQITTNVEKRTKKTRMIRRIRTNAAPHVTTTTVKPTSMQENTTQENAASHVTTSTVRSSSVQRKRTQENAASHVTTSTVKPTFIQEKRTQENAASHVTTSTVKPTSVQEKRMQENAASHVTTSTVKPTSMQEKRTQGNAVSHVTTSAVKPTFIQEKGTQGIAAPLVTTSTVRSTSARGKRTQENAKNLISSDKDVEEAVVISDLLVVRLPHENFVTGCLSSRCSK